MRQNDGGGTSAANRAGQLDVQFFCLDLAADNDELHVLQHETQFSSGLKWQQRRGPPRLLDLMLSGGKGAAFDIGTVTFRRIPDDVAQISILADEFRHMAGGETEQV